MSWNPTRKSDAGEWHVAWVIDMSLHVLVSIAHIKSNYSTTEHNYAYSINHLGNQIWIKVLNETN